MTSFKIAPMSVGGVQHLVERAYRESGEMQYVRELFVNALEAGATRIEFGPEWQAVEKEGVYRLMVADNGKGMSKDELLKFLNTFGGGGKPIGDAHENYGVGAKTSLLPWNHAGVVVLSWVEGDPEGSMVWLARDPDSGEYGAAKFKTADGGYHEVVLPPPDWAALKPTWFKGSGTVVVCLGNTRKEDTYLGKDGNGDIKGISAYLNKRIFEIPAGVEVIVQELRTDDKSKWPRSLAEASGPGAAKKGEVDRRWNRRRIRGSLHFVEYKPENGTDDEGLKGKLAAKGKVTLEDGTVIDWHLWEGERPAVHSYAHKIGFIAALYKNELYDTQAHQAQYRSFGVTQRSVRENLTLIARPPATDGRFGVYPDTARNALRIQGNKKAGESLPWSEWSYEFAEKMPEEIRAALAKAGPNNSSGTVRDASWRERLIDRFGARWKSLRFLLNPNGAELVKPIHGMGTKGGRRGGGGGGGGGGGSGPGPFGGAAGEPVFGAKKGGHSTPAMKTSSKGGIPCWEWDNGSEVDEGCAGAWSVPSAAHPNGVVLMNRSFPSFIEVKKFWRDQYPDHVSEVVERTIEDVYGEAMVARIAHSEEFVRDVVWGQARVDKELRSGASLTMAALGLMSEDQVIASRLSGVVGAKKKT